jgi:hypothetical protein
MKKLALFFALSVACIANSFAGSSSTEYFLNESSVDALVASSEEVQMADLVAMNAVDANGLTGTAQLKAGQDKTVFLLLNFFLGGIAIHRYYMGVDGAWYMFAGYACVPIAGAVAGCGDFFYVLFGTGSTHEEYADNKKWFVWSGK